jgi:orotate phosphoribosyltransferase
LSSRSIKWTGSTIPFALAFSIPAFCDLLGKPSGTKVVIVDDVVTTGGSVIEAIDAAQEAGCIVVGVITLVDRQEENGEARIRARVPHYFALYTRKDFPEIGEPDTWDTTTSDPRSAGVSS